MLQLSSMVPASSGAVIFVVADEETPSVPPGYTQTAPTSASDPGALALEAVAVHVPRDGHGPAEQGRARARERPRGRVGVPMDERQPRRRAGGVRAGVVGGGPWRDSGREDALRITGVIPESQAMVADDGVSWSRTA